MEGPPSNQSCWLNPGVSNHSPSESGHWVKSLLLRVTPAGGPLQRHFLFGAEDDSNNVRVPLLKMLPHWTGPTGVCGRWVEAPHRWFQSRHLPLLLLPNTQRGQRAWTDGQVRGPLTSSVKEPGVDREISRHLWMIDNMTEKA